MRVFIAGATGVLGKRLVARLAERGHEVVGLVRDDEGEEVVAERGGEPHHGDLFDPGSLVAGAEGADVVVHAATAIPTADDPSKTWELNDRIRREGTENLTAATAEVGAGRYLQQSIAWVARQPDGSEFDEDSPTHPTRTTASAIDAERTARVAGDEHGFGVGVLRGGWFYSADSAHFRDFGERLVAGRMAVVGSGLVGRRDARLSFVHADDVADAFAAAAEDDATGTWHVVDDEPATFAEVVTALADRLDAPEPRRLPGWIARFVVGRGLTEFLTTPMPTSNERFRAAFDWEPEYPTYRVGLDEVVEAWRDEGFPDG